MKRYALLGQNISYSLSPTIHQFHFQKLKIDASYELKDISDLTKQVNDLYHYSGFNVTIPYKEKIIAYCSFLSEEAKAIGAVNCIKVENDKFYGYNTDVFGFYQLLKNNALLNENKTVLIIGAGGAAKAVYYCLKHNTHHKLFMTNRTIEKAKNITRSVIPLQEVMIDDFDIVINCTNVGVKEKGSPIQFNKIKDNACFIDINYQAKSPFLMLAQSLGAKTINGLDMLIFQAAKSFEIWTNHKANIEAMYRSLRKEGSHVNK